jgi:hypothetical protein
MDVQEETEDVSQLHGIYPPWLIQVCTGFYMVSSCSVLRIRKSAKVQVLWT